MTILYSPYINHFIQPDTIIPNPANPQSWNRYSYVQNNPIRYTDPTGHKLVEDIEGGGPCNSTDCVDIINNVYQPKPQSNVTHGNSGPSTENYNTCAGEAPYLPQYTCGVLITERAGLQNIEPINIVIGGDTFTDFGPENPPVVNGQTFTPSYSGSSRGISILEILMMGIEALYYNKEVYRGLTDQYVQGAIPFAHHNNKGMSYVPGFAIYNHTGYDIKIDSVFVDDRQVSFSSPRIQSGNADIVSLSRQILSKYNSSIEINVSAFRIVDNVMQTYAVSQISFNGPIRP